MRKRSLIEPAVERLPDRLKLMIAVAEKALAMRKVHDAERLLASAARDYRAFAELASTPEALAELARVRTLLERALRILETVTGKPWTRSLDPSMRATPWRSRRGQA